MPKQMPTAEMFNAMSQAAQGFPEIAGMYFGQVTYPDGEPHWTHCRRVCQRRIGQAGQAHDGCSGEGRTTCFSEKRYSRLASCFNRSGAIDQDIEKEVLQL